jgi:type IV secretion system protein VirB9
MNVRPLAGLLGASALIAGLAAPALAAPDPRLVTKRYDPDQVVRIDGRAGVQATITFGESEQIENVAIGDSNAWQVTPNKRANALFVKPLAASARSNMTVITDKRTYYFDLVASASARPIYVLRFSYPDAPRSASAAGAGSAEPSVSLTEAESALAAGATPSDPAALNFAWTRKGKASLLPARIYDDGASVYVSWGPGLPVPAILIRDASGTEGPVNYAVRGDVIVIEGVPAQIVLRSGKDLATLDRAAPLAQPASLAEVAPRQALAETTARQGN